MPVFGHMNASIIAVAWAHKRYASKLSDSLLNNPLRVNNCVRTAARKQPSRIYLAGTTHPFACGR